MYRQFFIVIILIFSLTACQGIDLSDSPKVIEKATIPSAEGVTDTNSKPEEIPEINPQANETIPTLFEGYKALLTADTTAADLGNYIKDHIEDVSTQEAEEMIQWLIIYQTDLYQHYLYNAYESPYLDALNDTLGGVLDPTKINAIENDTVRATYQNLSDGFMTIVRYEESPYAQTDWSAIAAYKDLFSEEFAYLVNLRDQYAKTSIRDTYDIAEDIVILEDMIHRTNNPFHFAQLTDFHDELVNDLIIGPEGIYIGTFVGKSDHHYNHLMTFAGDFSHSDFAQLLYQLDGGDWSDFRGPLDLYDHYTAFSSKKDFYWTPTLSSDANVDLGIKTLNSDTQAEIAASANASIQDALNELIRQTNGTYAGSMNIFYSDDAYITAYLSLHYLKTPEETTYVEQALTIDLSTGKAITIAEYLSMTAEEALQTVNTLTDSDFTQLPNLEFTYNGIALRAQKSDPSETSYAELSLKDLVPYLSLEQLTR